MTRFRLDSLETRDLATSAVTAANLATARILRDKLIRIDTMNLDKLLATLRDAEGFRSEPYPDGDGWSVGYGHWSKEKPIGWVTRGQAESFLLDDVQTAIDDSWKALEYAFQFCNDAQQRCIAEMAFMLGYDRLCGFVNTLEAVRARNWQHAAAEILDSDAARKNPTRWGRLAKMMETGEDPTPSAAC